MIEDDPHVPPAIGDIGQLPAGERPDACDARRLRAESLVKAAGAGTVAQRPEAGAVEAKRQQTPRHDPHQLPPHAPPLQAAAEINQVEFSGVSGSRKLLRRDRPAGRDARGRLAALRDDENRARGARKSLGPEGVALSGGGLGEIRKRRSGMRLAPGGAVDFPEHRRVGGGGAADNKALRGEAWPKSDFHGEGLAPAAPLAQEPARFAQGPARVKRPVMIDLAIRFSPMTLEDARAAEKLDERAFGPGRFAKTAYRLREGVEPDLSLSFVARVGTLLIGANRMTPILVGVEPALLLGPLTVEPAFRSQGVGETLVKKSLDAARAAGHGVVLLVGDADYYARMGFAPAPRGKVSMPGPVNPDRLLYCELRPGAFTALSGKMRRA